MIRYFLVVIAMLFMGCSISTSTPALGKLPTPILPTAHPLQTSLPTIILTQPLPKIHPTETPTQSLTLSVPTQTKIVTLQPAPTPSWSKNLAVLGYPKGEFRVGDAIHPSVYLINSQMKIQSISANGHAFTPLAWSPKGDKLLFSTLLPNSEDDSFQIYELDPNSGEIEQLHLSFPGGTNRGDPDWSPDGTTLAFIEWGALTEYIHIWDAKENKIRLLTEGRSGKWVENGEALVFLKPVFGEKEIYGKDVWIGNQLYQIQANGGGLKQISTRITLSNLSISPDGIWTIFLENIIGNGELLKLDGTEVAQLGLGFDYLYEPTWFPDGKALLYADDCVLKRFDLETKESSPIKGLPEGFCYLYASLQP